jgi:pectate lyase
MLNRLPNNETDVPGYDHKLRNNLGYKGGKELANLDQGKSDSKENSFDLDLKFTDADFVSLDEKQLLQPRQKNGELPKIDFMRVRENSPLIIAGKALGRPTP